MKTKVITVATNHTPELKRLQDSCTKNNINLEILGMNNSWLGFGSKIIWLKEYLQTLKNYTHFIFVDAYDVIFLDSLKNIELIYTDLYKDAIVFSTEKACWPDANLSLSYPNTTSEWKYLNSGSYMSPIKKFLETIDKYPIKFSDDDQRYFTNIFLNDSTIVLDYNCELFQSVAFEADDDFTLSPHNVFNNKTKSFPAIIHANGKTDLTKFYKLLEFEKLSDLKENWIDIPEYHKNVHESLVDKVNLTPYLKAHRDFVEQNSFGFGERSFPWMWKLIVDEMPTMFSFLEVGVFRGQILSLIELIAIKSGKYVARTGITPLNSTEVHWESNYKADIERIHDEFDLFKDYVLIEGYSTDLKVIDRASKQYYDIVYIDGGHTNEVIKSDIEHYAPLVKKGGLLVIDDCACKYHMPWGYFQGIESVCVEVDKILPNDQFEEIGNVVHNRIWRRK